MKFSNHINSPANIINRRSLLGQSGIAIGSLAAASMLKAETRHQQIKEFQDYLTLTPRLKG